MSNYLAIATVTTMLREILQEAANTAIPGVEVTTKRPEDMSNGGQGKPIVNIFLYQVAPNGTWGNADLPTRSADGRLVRRPQAALDLHYLLSFYGPEKELVPQKLLGRVISALHARPLLSPGDELVERVRFSPLSLNLEELSKLWSVFFQIPYALSVAYQASVVLIEAQEQVPQPALPVLKLGKEDHGWDAVVGGIPQIEQILPTEMAKLPPSERILQQGVKPGAEITLKGRNLVADRFTVRFGDREKVYKLSGPDTVVTAEGDLQIKIPPDLAAGIIPVSVRSSSGIPSNPVALMLRPQISHLKQGLATVKSGVKVKTVTFAIEPPVQPGQRVLLLLNELKDIHDPEPRQAYSIAFSYQDKKETSSLTVPLPQGPEDSKKCQVQAGTYLVRVQIDGAESQLEPPTRDGKPYAGPYAEPSVTIR